MTPYPIPIPETSGGKRRRKLLVVDDNRFFLKSLKILINHEPDLIVCDMAESSEQLFQVVKQADPDVILMDVMLGSENGVEIAEELRKQGVMIPLILISALATPSQKVLQQIGRCAFWRKGDNPEGLLHCARTVEFIPPAEATA